MFKHAKYLTLSIAMLSIAVTLTACSPGSNKCAPAPLTATPASVSTGANLSISSPAAPCDLALADDATYEVRLISENDESQRTDVVVVPVASDGSFTAAVEVPAGFPIGNAQVLVTGSPLDSCDADASCAAYLTRVQVTG